jgi:hypothetical protein
MYALSLAQLKDSTRCRQQTKPSEQLLSEAMTAVPSLTHLTACYRLLFVVEAMAVAGVELPLLLTAAMVNAYSTPGCS